MPSSTVQLLGYIFLARDACWKRNPPDDRHDGLILLHTRFTHDCNCRRCDAQESFAQQLPVAPPSSLPGVCKILGGVIPRNMRRPFLNSLINEPVKQTAIIAESN